jgi:hypothetical protein
VDAAAAAALLGTAAAAIAGGLFAEEPEDAPEYLVKWVGRSHVHNEWVREGLLMSIAKRKLLNFKKKHGSAPCNTQRPEWTTPERLVARRPSPVGPGWDVLVKWVNLGYEHATWEVRRMDGWMDGWMDGCYTRVQQRAQGIAPSGVNAGGRGT